MRDSKYQNDDAKIHKQITTDLCTHNTIQIADL